MTIDETYYQALIARDARYDGKIFVMVKTTGIYCRPICPAPKPKPENCSFTDNPLVAEARGYRPCLRCRPETAPQSPAWSGTLATINRALKLIENGALDSGTVAQLADKCGVSDRHLRRLFQQHLGTSPKKVSSKNRLSLAHNLILGTNLDITDVAFAAGFKSLRRFNDSFKQTYGCPPSTLRRPNNDPS